MEKSVSTGLIGLTALASAGNLLIALPLSSDDSSDIIAALLAVAASLLLFGIGYPIASRILSHDIEKIKKPLRPLFAVLLIAVIGLVILIGINCLADFALFTRDVVLPERGLGFIFTALLITALFMASKKLSALSKAGSVLFVVSLVFTLVIFLLSVGDMSLKFIMPKSSLEIKSISDIASRLFVRGFLEAFLLISALGCKAESRKSVMLGNLLGGGVVVLSSLNTLLIFGGSLSESLPYPYASAVRAIGNGEVFSGMEGFLYVGVFLNCTVKAALAFFAVKTLAERLGQLKN